MPNLIFNSGIQNICTQLKKITRNIINIKYIHKVKIMIIAFRYTLYIYDKRNNFTCNMLWYITYQK